MTENSNNMLSEHWFEACPAGLLILDQEGCVQSINPALCHILGQQPNEILGRNMDQLQPPELKGLFHPDGQLQLFPNGMPAKQLKIESRVIPNSHGMTLRCFTDISEGEALREENVRLKQQVEELTLTDKLTGLANERAFHRVLSAQVTRSRRYANPLCLAVVEIDAKPGEEVITQEVVLAVSRYLRDRLRWVDLIARWSNDQFMLIMPETSAKDASNTLNKLKTDFAATGLPESITHLTIGLNIGITEWQKGNDGRLLMKRTMEALAEVKEAEANRVT
jgi:diguanylate cyclase (GGDEF)-like protein